MQRITHVDQIPEFPRVNIPSFLELQTEDQYIYQNPEKKDLKDFTFVIPIQIDSEYRWNNFHVCIQALNKICDTNILVIESDKKPIIENLPKNCEYIFLKQENDYFERNKILNLGYKKCKTKFAANFEADCILSPKSLYKAADAMRKGYKFAIPFANFALFMSDKASRNFMEKAELPLFWKDFYKIEYCSEYENKMNWEHYTFHLGLCCLFDIESFRNCGFENENLVQHGWDDFDRYLRIKKFGYDIFSSSGISYHLYHERIVKVNNFYGDGNKSPDEFFRLANMTDDELKKEVESWTWIKN